ncbi:AMP-binding protein, partial [Streptomyces sp. HSW2009]|uniref:AMP-binding protein n=1 Tax=Streptomyces sp. HSW2009 TaxID=3142890 RepID=UPI0032EBC47B
MLGLFGEQVLLRGGSVAVRDGVGGVLTYGELDVRSDVVAGLLVGRGVGVGDVVGVGLPRSVDLLVVLLGVWKAGAGFVPLDVEFPVDRLGFVVRDCGLGLLVTVEGLVGVFSGLGVELLVLDSPGVVAELGVVEEGLGGVVLPGVVSGGVAYVIYTSGSTGWPKGVVVSHGALVNVLVG